MNTNQFSSYVSKNWLKIIFVVSGSVFLLSSVSWADAFYLWSAMSYPNPLLEPFLFPYGLNLVSFFQYLAVIAFIFIMIRTLMVKRGAWSLILMLAYGFLTFLIVLFASVTKYAIYIPPTGWPGEPAFLDTVGKLTIYASAISGLIAAVSGLYNQIIAGRKALAEIQLEKMRLEVEQEKAKAKVGRRKTAKSRK